MAVLNPSPSAPLPKTMWLVAKAFSRANDWQAAVPSTLHTPQDGGHVKAASAALKQLGWEELDARGMARVSSAYPLFMAWLRAAVSDPRREEAQDFRDGIEWLMRQNPLVSLSRNNYESLGGANAFVNNERWNIFRFWAVDLGFAQPSSTSAQSDEGGITANPVKVIVEATRSWEPFRSAVPIRTYLDRLRESVSLLPSHDQAVALDPMGEAVSWAILGAHYRGWIELSSHADARQTFFTNHEPDTGYQSVSHVVTRSRGDE